MSLFSRFARTKAPQDEVPETPVNCAHRDLAPRWDSAVDMGKKEKITSFTCGSCKQSFSPDEAAGLVPA
jgi:hypothetical protein